MSNNCKYEISKTIDNVSGKKSETTFVKFTTTNQRPTADINKFHKEHPEMFIDEFVGFEKRLDPESKGTLYSYTFSVSQRPTNTHGKSILIYSINPKLLPRVAVGSSTFRPKKRTL